MRKLCYGINMTAAAIDISPHTLRYWEKEFAEFLHPARTKGGHRQYGPDEIIVLLKIKRLVHDEKFTVKGAIQQLTRERDRLAKEKKNK